MKQYITFLLCLFTVLSYSQEKRVHLVHGLGGDSGSWEQFSAELEAECPGLITTTFENTSNEGLDEFSKDLRANLESIGKNPNDVAIGHSFGGLNLRNIDNEGYFGGYITVGSVHEGAPIANAAIDGTFKAWINSGCREVFTEPLNALLNLDPFFTDPDLLTGSSEFFICDAIYNALIKQAGQFLGEGKSVIDLLVDGTVANLPSASIPGIGIVCSTQGHPLWNLLDDGDFLGDPLGTKYWKLAATIEHKANSASKLFSTLSTLSTFSPFGIFVKRKFKKASKEFKDAANWMKSTEAAWNELIGAGGGITWVDHETVSWDCGCYNVTTGESVPCTTLGSSDEITILDIGPDMTCSQNTECWQITIVSAPIFGNDLPSDGLIPVNRQSLPGSFHEEPITNVSHFAEPKDFGVKNVLKDHLNPSTSINPIFSISTCL